MVLHVLNWENVGYEEEKFHSGKLVGASLSISY